MNKIIENNERFLYHVSLESIENFKLRIPKYRLEGEDKTTKRICFSKTIEGAFSAIPHGSEVLAGLFKIKETCDISPIFHVYILDSRNIKKVDIVDSEQLYSSRQTLDAILTEEVWVLTEKIKPKHKLIEIVDFTERQELLLRKNAVKIVSHIECNWFDFTPESIDTNKKVKQGLEFWRWIKDEYKKLNNKELSVATIRSFLTEY